jgi:hypothetical protein
MSHNSARNAARCASIVVRRLGEPISSSPSKKNFRFTIGVAPEAMSAE